MIDRKPGQRPAGMTPPKGLPPSPPVPEPRAAEPRPESGGRGGPDPTRYGDWESKGIAIDF